MTRSLRRALAAVALLTTLTAAAASAQPVLDLSRFDATFSAEPTVEMDLRGTLLNTLRRSMTSEDPDMARVMSGLRAMQMRIYELNNRDSRRAFDQVTALGRTLRADGWESFMRVRDDGDYVDMLTRPEGDAIGGFVMLVVSPDADETQVVLLNFIGRIDPEQAARIGRRMSNDRTRRTLN